MIWDPFDYLPVIECSNIHSCSHVERDNLESIVRNETVLVEDSDHGLSFVQFVWMCATINFCFSCFSSLSFLRKCSENGRITSQTLFLWISWWSESEWCEHNLHEEWQMHRRCVQHRCCWFVLFSRKNGIESGKTATALLCSYLSAACDCVHDVQGRWRGAAGGRGRPHFCRGRQVCHSAL